MPKNSIYLSEKHGVNPSLMVCFWCGEATGVALLGRLPNDAEAPRQIAADYDPCDACKARWKQGIALIEALETPERENQVAFHGAYPTGRYMVITEDAVRRIMQPIEAVEDTLRTRLAFVEPAVFKMLHESYQRVMEG